MKEQRWDFPERCENCKHVAKRYGHSSAYFDCRRHSPKVFSEEHRSAVWPLVQSTYWCGDYEKAVEETP